MATNDSGTGTCTGMDTAASSQEQDAMAPVMSLGGGGGGESLQPQRTNDTTRTLNNPWNVSPAVTSSQSELSASSGSVNGTAVATTASAEATATTTTVPMTRTNSNPAVAGSCLAPPDEQIQQTNATGTAAAASASADNQDEHDAGSVVPFTASTSPNHHTTTPPTLAPTLAQQHHNTNFVQNASHDSNSNNNCSSSTSTSSHSNGISTSNSDYHEGGRLWQAALKEAEQNNNNNTATAKQRSRFAESIMERTRSRADPNALIVTSTTTSTTAINKPSMVSLGDHESSFILSTALAKKRVRVVQLLVIGLVGLLLGLLGNFFVSTSCHFATVHIGVGQNEQTFEFHFGLWKYSPIDSVFQGYPYCYKYDQNYQSEAPVVARIANITALVAGLISISILWLYLILGVTDKRRWKWAVRMAVLAGLVQLATLYFFVGTICQEYSCQWGPAAYLSIFTSLVWFVLACEMQYHMPVAAYASGPSAGPAAALEEPRSLVNTMEMTHLDDVTREYMTRVTGKTKDDEMPSLNKMDLKRVRPKLPGLYSASQTPTSTTASHGNGSSTAGQPPPFHITSPRGTYKAPDPALLEEALASPSSRR